MTSDASMRRREATQSRGAERGSDQANARENECMPTLTERPRALVEPLDPTTWLEQPASMPMCERCSSRLSSGTAARARPDGPGLLGYGPRPRSSSLKWMKFITYNVLLKT